jgi:hypothetical protein
MILTKKTMEIEDFMAIIAQNKEHYPEYANLPEETKRFMAQLNISTGVAESYFDSEGKLFAVGGMRYCGVGEAWVLSTPQARQSNALTLFKNTAANLKLLRDKLNLIKVYADADINSNFLEHLGFNKTNNTLLWIRS